MPPLADLAVVTTCPTSARPWRHTIDGPMPMFVPPDALNQMRSRYPAIWIEPLARWKEGSAPITMAEWKRLALPDEAVHKNEAG